jgi:glycosyltransferase involved in cell wall biosynthesis
MNIICLDKNYSTTSLLVKEKPYIVNIPEDKFETVLFLSKGENRKDECGLRKKGYFKKSYENKPLVSIITVVFNGEKYLEETIKSVLNQTYDNIEYIIIDGGSTDSTLDIIRKYEDKIDYWVSEKDKGIYDAMNKGISLCLGSIIGIINADDWYTKDSVKIIVEQNKLYSNVDIFFGDMILINEETKQNKLLIGSLNGLNKDMTVNHPTCFVQKALYKEILFDTSYKICADYDLILYFFSKNKKFCYVNTIIANMRIGGVSDNFNLSTNEVYKVQVKYYGKKKAIYNNIVRKLKRIIKNIAENIISLSLIEKIKGFNKIH